MSSCTHIFARCLDPFFELKNIFSHCELFIAEALPTLAEALPPLAVARRGLPSICRRSPTLAEALPTLEFLFSAKSTQSIFCGPQSDTADLRSGSPSRACGGVGRSCRDCPVTLSPIVHQSYTVDLRSIFNPRLLSFCRDCVCTSGQILLDWSNFFGIFSVRGHANF